MLAVKIKLKLDAPWVHSLKEKRSEVKILCSKLRSKFNISVAEIEEQDTHQTIVIGIAYVAADSTQADSIADHILSYLEQNTQCDFDVLIREMI